MFCPNCGNEVKNGARFCSVCGTDVVQAYEQANEELTQVDNGFQDVDSFDNTGFMLPNENAFSSPYNAEQQSVNDYGDLDKTQAFIRPDYDSTQIQNPYEPQSQMPYVDNGGYVPEQQYMPAPEYNNNGYESGYGADYPNAPYIPDYPQGGGYYPPENQQQQPPKKGISTASIILIGCAIILAVLIGAGTAIIHTQYGGFEEFFSSFSDDKKDDDDDEEDEETQEGVTESEEVTGADETTTLPEATQPTTTLPPTTVTQTVPATSQPGRVGDGYCGTNLQYDFDPSTGELVIFGTGDMYDYSSTYAPWESNYVKRVVVEEGVTSVSEGSLTTQHLEYIYLSSTVSDFSIFALDYFASIEVSPANPYYMSKDGVLFDKNGSVLICYPNENARTSYAVPNSVKWIGPYAFFNADNLTQLTLSSNVLYIDEYAFKSCNGLLTFTVPASVLEIETGIFYNWESNQQVYFESGDLSAAEDWNEGCEAEIIVAE